jgi:hypothetical protein
MISHSSKWRLPRTPNQKPTFKPRATKTKSDRVDIDDAAVVDPPVARQKSAKAMKRLFPKRPPTKPRRQARRSDHDASDGGAVVVRRRKPSAKL